VTGPRYDLSTPSVTDDLATAEQIAELRGGDQVWLALLHQASAHLGNCARYPHGRLCRAALEVAAEHIRSAEKILRELDDMLDPKQNVAGRERSTRHLQQRVEREQHALRQVS
jgi:hypothetical protein